MYPFFCVFFWGGGGGGEISEFWPQGMGNGEI